MGFLFEQLEVYQKAVDLADRVIGLTGDFPRGFGFLGNQLHRASMRRRSSQYLALVFWCIVSQRAGASVELDARWLLARMQVRIDRGPRQRVLASIRTTVEPPGGRLVLVGVRYRGCCHLHYGVAARTHALAVFVQPGAAVIRDRFFPLLTIRFSRSFPALRVGFVFRRRRTFFGRGRQRLATAFPRPVVAVDAAGGVAGPFDWARKG